MRKIKTKTPKNKLVTVYVGDNGYRMTKEESEGLIKIGRESVHNGVYAAKKKGAVILLNEPEISTERFTELCGLYNAKGFVLLHNRGVKNG